MIAYNSRQLDHVAMQQQANEALDHQVITAEEFQRIRSAYPVELYTPNFYIRIGMFLLTLMIALFSFGLLCLFFMDAAITAFGVLSLIAAIGCYITLEALFIRQKKHYQSGVDDALMWMCAALLMTSLFIFDEKLWDQLPFFTILFVISGFFAVRFTDRIMALLSFLSFLCLLFFICLEIGSSGETIAPFLLMAVSFAVYFGVRRLQRLPICRHYTPALGLVAICSLVTGYLAGNYFIVREVGSSLLGETLAPQQDIPAGWLFRAFTVIIPLLYIYFGIRKKDRMLICTGLLLVSAIAFTIRYYYGILPMETAMLLGGVSLIGVAYTLNRYLRQPKNGFTSETPASGSDMEGLQLESLVIAEAFQQTPATEEPSFQFRGGSGGGAGSTGDF